MSDIFGIKRLGADDIPQLAPCLRDLAAYHNALPTSFSGVYPLLPVDITIAAIAAQVREGKAVADAVHEGDRIVGFSSVSVEAAYGQVENLFVSEDRRGHGYGRMLMERALEYFRSRGVRLVDIRVLNGNPSEGFYAKYGFTVRSLVMARTFTP